LAEYDDTPAGETLDFSEFQRAGPPLPSIELNVAFQEATAAVRAGMTRCEKETSMPFGISSVELLRDTFRRAVKQALERCEETHPSHYRSRCRFLANASWVEIGSNVQVIQVAETEFLLRGSWQYTIDLRTKNQFAIAQAQISEIAALLASVVPRGEAVKGAFEFPPSEISPSGERVTCSFRGVVRGQVPCRSAA